MRSLLIVVHPGSACGSADFNLGRRLAAERRAILAREIREWAQDLLVLHGELSDEIERYDGLAKALAVAEFRATQVGSRFEKVSQCCDLTDPRWVSRAVDRIEACAGEKRITFTGAWFDPVDGHGCINAVFDALAHFPHRSVADSALICSQSRLPVTRMASR